ncbi:MAG: N-acetylmuramoyl-L-alanine amidase [Flavobacteriaceae bacterium]|nr:N-acetylmuramoyl-L-alanine amidase [Flavobacteriaceae bacterium]
MTYIRVRNTINVVYKKVLDVYFAKITEETIFETEEGKKSEYIAKKGDYLSTIASKNKITLKKLKEDNNLKSNEVSVGQKFIIKQNDKKVEKGKEVTFTKSDKATLGEEVYIIIKTENLDGIEIEINVMQGKEKLLAEKDRTICLLKDDKKKIKTIVGEYAKNDKITNKEDFKDWAIAKVTLAPKEEKTLKSYTKALKDATDKKTYLFLAVNACTDIEDQTIFYKDGKIDKTSTPNYYLNEKDKWLELKGCECCNMKIKKDGYIDNGKITKEQIKTLEQNKLDKVNAVILHRTVTSNKKSAINSFKTGVGTHFLVAKDGKIYQTASLNNYTYHVGHIKSKAYENNISLKEELKIIKGFRKLKPNKSATRAEHKYEIKKTYPKRYPYNEDSIGIEVVGMPIDKNGNSTIKAKEIVGWQSIPEKQAKSISCLVKFLLEEYNLTSDDIYTHEQISRKTKGEGGEVFNIIKKFLNLIIFFTFLASCNTKLNQSIDSKTLGNNTKKEIKQKINQDSSSISFLEPVKFSHPNEIIKIQKNVIKIENNKMQEVLKINLKVIDSLKETEKNYWKLFVFYNEDKINKIKIKKSYISYSLNNNTKDKNSFLYVEHTKIFYFINQEIIFTNDSKIVRDIINEKVDYDNIGGWSSADFYWKENRIFDLVSIGLSKLERDDYDPEKVYLNEIITLKKIIRNNT